VLTRLTIKNYALIRSLEMVPGKGLNVITGETGAGKSIMSGALGLLLGNRADTKVLLDQNEKCITEGVFQIGDYQLESIFEQLELDHQPETIIRREISPGGKSRAFINDSPVTLEVMKKIGLRLMDIHSQHETLELGEAGFQLKLIDLYSGNEQLRKDYVDGWTAWKSEHEKLLNLEAESEKLKQEADFIRFQLQEIDRLNLVAEDDSNLESALKVQENAEVIKSKLVEAIGILGEQEFSTRKTLLDARALLNNLASFSPVYATLAARIESIRIELEDITHESESAAEEINFDSEKATELRQRLDAINNLQRKHRVNSSAALIAIGEELRSKVVKTDGIAEMISVCKKDLAVRVKKRDDLASKLSASRLAVVEKLCKELRGLLKELGIPDAKVLVQHAMVEAGPTGIDRLNILFSANKGVEPVPIAQAASGGEFSRLMFCIKYIMAGQTSLPTLVLDEIDTGISGEIALRLGELMRKMSQKHQIIAITHLAQIAAKGATHYLVFKDTSTNRASSDIRLLDKKERENEIARIISGSSPSKAALEHARELMS